jgi:hypothetical protein
MTTSWEAQLKAVVGDCNHKSLVLVTASVLPNMMALKIMKAQDSWPTVLDWVPKIKPILCTKKH